MKPRTRPAAFQPRLVQADEDRDAVNAEFRREAAAFRLQYRCPDCAFVRPLDGRCSVGWPNATLMREPFEAIGADGIPAFCKAFEPLEY